MFTAVRIAILSLATMVQNPDTAPELAPLGTVIFRADLDGPAPLREWTAAAVKPAIAVGPGDAKCVVIERPAAQGPGSAMVRASLPVEKVRGCRLRCEALVAATNVVKPPHPWSGVKFMIHTAGGGEDTWQQQDNVFGSFDWKPVRFIAAIPAGATSAEVALGLEATTGTARFTAIRLTVIGRPRSASHFAGTMDRRTDVPRLRGVMIPTNVTAADLEVLAGQWKANHVRWQLTWGGFPRSPADGGDLAAYDTWLNSELDRVDTLLPTCAKLGIHVLIDLHTPPGGRDDASVCRLFQDRKYQDHFLAVWDRIARRYVGKAAIWGYDLVNEPVEGVVPDGLSDWHALALETARRVRAIDKDHSIIVEPAPWGSLAGLDHFEPLDVPGVIYSAHMYEPHQFTHQGVLYQATGVTYPGTIAGLAWNKEQIRRTFGPAIRYQQDYHVPIYIGEFSAIRWAPGAAAYLRDVIEVMEENQWDWAYHAFREWDGWSVEHGPDRDVHHRAATPTDRESLLRSNFAKNVPAISGTVRGTR